MNSYQSRWSLKPSVSSTNTLLQSSERLKWTGGLNESPSTFWTGFPFWGAGAYPYDLWVRGGVHPEQVSTQSQGSLSPLTFCLLSCPSCLSEGEYFLVSLLLCDSPEKLWFVDKTRHLMMSSWRIVATSPASKSSGRNFYKNMNIRLPSEMDLYL